MQPIEKFDSNLGTAILLVGGAGAGKTSLGCRLFPKTYVNVTDLNFESAKRYLERQQLLGNIVGWDSPLVDEKGKAVSANKRYDLMFKQINEAIEASEVDAIFLDSATFIEDVIKGKICNATSDAAIKLTGFDHWGTLVLTWKSLVMQLRQSGKKLIMSAHEQKEKDESDQVFKYQIAVDGSIRGKFPALFSDVWRCEVTENQGKHTWNVRTLGNIRQEHLKNTYGLPGVLLQDDLVKQIQNAK